MSVENDTPLNRLRRWQQGEMPGPWYVFCCPTNRCNLECVMCWQRYFPVNPNREVPDERLLELVDECADLGCRDWLICGGGEPLMRAALVVKMCERILQRNMTGALQNNATLLTPDLMRRFVGMQWEFINCSIDGPTPEIHDALRGQGMFEQSTSAIAQCVAVRREMNSSKPGLRLHNVVMRHNYDVLPAIVELASQLGCDAVRAGLSCVHHGREHLVTAEQRKALPAIVEKAKARGRELGIETDFDQVLYNPWGAVYRREARVGRALGGNGAMAGAFCFDPWSTLSVFGDGRITPCSLGWKQEAPKITSAPLKEIWSGPFMTEMRRQMAEEGLLECCHTCPSILDNHTHTLRPTPWGGIEDYGQT